MKTEKETIIKNTKQNVSFEESCGLHPSSFNFVKSIDHGYPANPTDQGHPINPTDAIIPFSLCYCLLCRHSRESGNPEKIIRREI